MRTVGARDLKLHTGKIIARVQSGERLLLTLRGRPVAVIAPIYQDALDAAIARGLEEAGAEAEGWLALAEGAFAFWDNDEDAVWNQASV